MPDFFLILKLLFCDNIMHQYSIYINFTHFCTPTTSCIPQPHFQIHDLLLNYCVCRYKYTYMYKYSFMSPFNVAHIYVFRADQVRMIRRHVRGLFPRKDSSFLSHYTLIAPSSVSRGRNLWDFPIHASIPTDAVILQILSRETNSPLPFPQFCNLWA